MRLIDADAIKIPKGFFEKVDNVPKFYDWLDDQPTIEAEPVKHGRWIPVSERLPEEDTEVLISYRYKEGEGNTSHVDIDITTYGQMYFGGNKVGYFHSNYEVIAWMPLPEPYKREDNDEEEEA